MTELRRVLEPEAMDTAAEARDYDAMDHAEVNARFVADFLAVHGPCRGGAILDLGTGPARIPIALCRLDPSARVLGLDLSQPMLTLAARNVAEAGLSDRIRLARGDAKELPWPAGAFEAVVSNSIVHHIPEPAGALAAMALRVAPGGTLFVRDLARPASRHALERLVETYAGREAPAAQALFAASLHAALTLEELRRLAADLGLPPACVAPTSDRHWTLAWRRPADDGGAGR